MCEDVSKDTTCLLWNSVAWYMDTHLNGKTEETEITLKSFYYQ